MLVILNQLKNVINNFCEVFENIEFKKEILQKKIILHFYLYFRLFPSEKKIVKKNLAIEVVDRFIL